MRRLIAAAALAAPALRAPAARGAGGFTPISPKKGESVQSGQRAIFKMKYSGKGPIYVHVCKSPRKDNDGLICDDESIGKARKTSSTRAVYRAKFFDFPAFWLNNPGTYYWQPHRISCENGIDDCRIEGPVVRFRVV
jgi:hypothetical protein